MTNIVECCLLCLELNKKSLDSIETNSYQWKELGVKEVVEAHFWSLNSDEQKFSCICSACWHEVNNFHKFYLRIEEAHMNFGRIKIEPGNQILQSKKEEEDTDLPFYPEPEILIDQNDLPDVAIKKEENGNDFNNYLGIDIDPLKEPIVITRNIRKKSKTKYYHTPKSIHNAASVEGKKGIHSDNNDNENASHDDDDDYNYEPDQNTAEYKSRKEDDNFIAEHFKQMFCNLCDAEFENFITLKRHFLLVHSVRRGYAVCCNRRFFQRHHLVDHLQCHLNPEYFKCTQCEKILSDRKSLQAHKLRIHRPDNVAPKYSCEICGKSFIMAYLLREHKLKHLPKEEKKFPCAQCGKFYASSYLLKIHTEVIHLKKLAKVCHICGETLRTSTEYKAHLNKHAGNNNPSLNCDVCGLRLISERSLKLHKDSQHPVGGKQDHPCPTCGKISPTARALKKHIVTMHEKGLDHKCTMCEKAFRRPEALKGHMASHTGIALYKCPWCPKAFNSNGNMHAHRKNKHPKESLELKLQRYISAVP